MRGTASWLICRIIQLVAAQPSQPAVFLCEVLPSKGLFIPPWTENREKNLGARFDAAQRRTCYMPHHACPGHPTARPSTLYHSAQSLTTRALFCVVLSRLLHRHGSHACIHRFGTWHASSHEPLSPAPLARDDGSTARKSVEPQCTAKPTSWCWATGRRRKHARRLHEFESTTTQPTRWRWASRRRSEHARRVRELESTTKPSLWCRTDRRWSKHAWRIRELESTTKPSLWCRTRRRWSKHAWRIREFSSAYNWRTCQPAWLRSAHTWRTRHPGR